MSEWISVEDDVPESGRYLIRHSNSIINCAYYLSDKKYWLSEGVPSVPIKISHWCPIPAFDCPEPVVELELTPPWTHVSTPPKPNVAMWVKLADGSISLAYKWPLSDRWFGSVHPLKSKVIAWRSLTWKEYRTPMDELLLTVVGKPEIERREILHDGDGHLVYQRPTPANRYYVEHRVAGACDSADFFGFEYADGFVRPDPSHPQNKDGHYIGIFHVDDHAKYEIVRPVAVLFRRAKA